MLAKVAPKLSRPIDAHSHSLALTLALTLLFKLTTVCDLPHSIPCVPILLATRVFGYFASKGATSKDSGRVQNITQASLTLSSSCCRLSVTEITGAGLDFIGKHKTQATVGSSEIWTLHRLQATRLTSQN